MEGGRKKNDVEVRSWRRGGGSKNRMYIKNTRLEAVVASCRSLGSPA